MKEEMPEELMHRKLFILVYILLAKIYYYSDHFIVVSSKFKY